MGVPMPAREWLASDVDAGAKCAEGEVLLVHAYGFGWAHLMMGTATADRAHACLIVRLDIRCHGAPRKKSARWWRLIWPKRNERRKRSHVIREKTACDG